MASRKHAEILQQTLLLHRSYDGGSDKRVDPAGTGSSLDLEVSGLSPVRSPAVLHVPESNSDGHVR